MLEPTAVALQAAFLAVLYLFIVWVARSSLRDLRRPDDTRIAVVPPADADRLLEAMRNHRLGRNAALIGEVVADIRA